ncbi:MAG: PQQ-binding-like beta-propeller repeat protein [Leptolinea sp.]|nr:PQQ-binding-like beta-propeller repeat protein [Leptolinea sp.]
MQRNPNFPNISLIIALLIKIFMSVSLLVVAVGMIMYATNTATTVLKTPRTPRPTMTRQIKTPMTLFFFKTPASTKKPLPTPTPKTNPIVRVTAPTIAPATPTSAPIVPTTAPAAPAQNIPTPSLPPTVQIQPTAAPAQSNPVPANNLSIPSVQPGFQVPEQTFRLDNLAYLRLIGQLGKGKINQVLWSPSGGNQTGLFAATSGGFFYLDPTTGADTGSVLLNTGITGAAISQDGTLLATSGLDKSIILWKYGTKEAILSIDSQGKTYNSLKFSPDGTALFGGGADGAIAIWKVADGSLLKQLDGNGSPIRSLAVSLDGQLVVAGSEDKTLSMWNVESGVRFISITAHYKPVNIVAISPDSRIIASGSDDNTFILWDTSNGKQLRLTPATSGVRSLTFNGDGSGIVTGEQNGTVNLWEVATGKLNKTISKVPGEVNSLAFNADYSILAIGANTLHLWRASDDALAAPFRGFSNSVTSVAFNKDATLLAAGNQDGRISLWDPKTGNQIALLEGHTGDVAALTFSNNGRFLASGGADNNIIVWDVTSGQKVYVIRGHSGGIRSLAFNNDGNRLASTGGWVDITLKMWDMASGTGLYNITGFTKGDIELALRQGTNMLASAGGDGIIRVWNFDTRELVTTLEKHRRAIRAISFSLDGNLLASTSEDGETFVWETNGWTLSKNLQTKGSNSLLFSTDNLVLAVAGQDVEFWDMGSGNLLTGFAGTPGTLSKLAETADGKVLVVGSTDGTIRLYGILQ